MESSGLSRCVCPEEGQGAAQLWGPSSIDSEAGVLKEVLNDLHARIRAGRPPHKRGSYATQTTNKTSGWKPPKLGVAPRKSALESRFGPPSLRFGNFAIAPHIGSKMT